jgi:mRNA interferase MazF
MASDPSRHVVRRGEIWRVALDPVVGSEQAKTRPCVIVQRDAANDASRTTIVVPITDAAGRKPSIAMPLLPRGDGGLTKDSIGLCHQVRAVDRLRLRGKLGELRAESLARVDRGIEEILDLSNGADARA